MNTHSLKLHRWAAAASQRLIAALLLAAASPSFAAPLCLSSTPANLLVLDPALSSAQLADLTLSCSGGHAGDPPATFTFQLFFGVQLLGTTAPTLSDGTTSDLGVVSSNQATFQNVAVDLFDATLVFSQLFVDPSAAADGLLYTAFVAASGASPLPISNPSVTLAINGVRESAQVGEPASLALVSSAATALWWFRRRRGSVIAARAQAGEPA